MSREVTATSASKRARSAETAVAQDDTGSARQLEIAELMQRVALTQLPHVQEVMYTSSEIDSAAQRLAEQISSHYYRVLSPGESLIVVGLLNGAVPFMVKTLQPAIPSTTFSGTGRQAYV